MILVFDAAPSKSLGLQMLLPLTPLLVIDKD